ncbi:unnamed protein product [Alopecurus aequalis]
MVLRRWRHRWNKPPTLLRYQQVTRCIDIAVRCRQLEPSGRPSISEIISTLTKSENTDVHSDERRPHFDEDDMLGIKPLELILNPSELEEISCFIVELTNDTSNHIAFNIQLPRRQQYNAQPAKGIVQPKSRYNVKITVQARDVDEHDHADKITVQSVKAREGLRDEGITEDMFHDVVSKVVDEVKLMVVYDPASGQRKLGSQLLKRASFSHHYHTNMKYLEKESDRAVDVTRGAMGSLLDKLGKLVIEDYNLEKSMKADIESFSQELMKIYLDLPKLEKLHEAKIWVNEVRDLSYKIEDMVDGFLVHVEHESNRSSFRELPHDFPNLLENGNNQIGDVIRDIKNKLQVVAEKGERYNSDVENVVANATTKATTDLQISAIYKDKEQLIGIKVPKDELIRLFEEDGDVPKKSLKIFSITGMGGLGKTTLAKAVYDKLQKQYHTRAFVTVGQNPDVQKVLKNILTECQNDASNLEHLDVPQLVNLLLEFLEHKRYFIVIDDLWDSEKWDTEAWDTIKCAFPANNYGSRVITTTRKGHVATACCYDESKYIQVMKPLSDEDSRRLFFSRVFGSQDACPDELKEVSNDILKRCGGLPLAINCIASHLTGDQPRSIWADVRKNWASVIDGNDLEKMNQILDLTYIHLPDQVKPCLLYVGMYPNDQIDKNDLVRQWVSEGFVHTSTDGMDAEDGAELYFRVLLGTYMIQPEKRDDSNIKVLSCRVHPIMLDLIRAKALKENFFHVIDGSKDERGEIHRLSVHYNGKEGKRIMERIEEGSLSHVRSVLFYRTSLVPYFLEFKYVRVLHLEHKVSFMGDLDLTGISRLFLLRYLKVTSDEIGYELRLPDKIGALQQLETIDLHNASLRNYPSDIVSLPWLKHLNSTGNKAGVVLPDGIEKLKFLRTLVGVDGIESSVENIKGITKLTNLRELHICLDGSVDPTTEHMNALHSSIPLLSTSLRILTLGSKCHTKLDVLTAQFPRGSHIWELDLGRCEYERCPEWIGQLSHLSKLTIWVREVADCISIVARLPSLAFFNLSIARGSEHKEESVVFPGGRAFQALKTLIFYCQATSLTFESGAMPKLESLTILFRYHMSRQLLPVGIEHLPTGNLKDIWLYLAPNDDSHIAVTGQHRTSVMHMLKGAFRQHHPAAQIHFTFGDGYPVPMDQEETSRCQCHIM